MHALNKDADDYANKHRKLNKHLMRTTAISGGISVGICPSENLMYIKAMVNGAPSLMVYTITPCETKQNLQNDEVSSRLERLEDQIEEIKKLLSGGGKLKNEL